MIKTQKQEENQRGEDAEQQEYLRHSVNSCNNTSGSYYKRPLGSHRHSQCCAGLREVVVLTEPLAVVWERDICDGWHPNPAPKPAVASDPVYGTERRKTLYWLRKNTV